MVDLDDVALMFVAATFILLAVLLRLFAVLAGVHAFSCSGGDRLLYVLLALTCGVVSFLSAVGAAIALDELLGLGI
jgi:hypothetical protein